MYANMVLRVLGTRIYSAACTCEFFSEHVIAPVVQKDGLRNYFFVCVCGFGQEVRSARRFFFVTFLGRDLVHMALHTGVT